MAKYRRHNNDGGLVFGVLVLGAGILLLLKKIGIFYPDWLLSWPMILIVVGLLSLVKSNFKSFFGGMMIGIGLYFLFEREFNFDFGFQAYMFPVLLIILGIYLITKKKRENQILSEVQAKIRNQSSNFQQTEKTDADTEANKSYTSDQNTYSSYTSNSSTKGATFSDTVNIDAILSGVNKRVMTKNFQGAKLTALMGGIDLDMTQVDLTGIAIMQVDVIFGGVKLVLPPHWDVRIEVTNIAAGVEDKRMYRQVEVDSDKVLVIKGTVLFGGLEIKSY